MNIGQELLVFQMQIKLYHWNTSSYARHMAADKLHTAMDPLIDNFMEVLIGKYGRSNTAKSGTIKFKPLTDDTVPEYLREKIRYLTTEVPALINDADTDLLNVRDEMLGALNQALYLFTLQ